MVCRRPTSRLSVPSITAGLMLGLAALTGCAAQSAASPRQPGGRPPPIPQAAGESVPGLSWAMVRTGGPSVGGRFWQLLVDATLVPGATGRELTALVPGLDTVTVWKLTAHGGWRRSQVISVPSTPGGQSR